ncbi:MAG: chromosome segregation protein, partial [Verrucomicrobiales bacterium]
MRLKSLDIHGFKSFADKTLFEFHPGVTGIVGPNGCGKSNVVDAIRWVLGETSAKALRGGEMADVIFNGTDNRQPVGMAEVTLTLADCEEALKVEYNEVSVTRRVFRDGKSEYRLNGTLCRLKDVHEMFMDTGIGRSSYSIMEQGKIDKLLSSKPEDRRAVFEEAAGITKFKVEKKEALRKLDYTEANLLRHSDILEELKRQMNSLNRQAGKARRYQALLKDVRVLDSHYSYRQFTNLNAEKSELDTSIRSLSNEQEQLGQQISQKEGGIVDARDSLQELEAEIGQQREQVIDKQNRTQSAKNRIGFNEERVRELTDLIEQNTTDLSQTRGRLLESEDEFRATTESLTNIEHNIERQRSQLEDHRQKTEEIRHQRVEIAGQLEQVAEESSGFESRLHSTAARLASSQGQLENDNVRNSELARELTLLDEAREEKSTEHHQIKEEFHHRQNDLEQQRVQLLNIEREHQQTQNDHERVQGELAAKHREHAERSSRLEVLQQLVADGEGLLAGTQAVIKGLDNPEFFHPGVRGLLSSFIEVDAEFIPAIETALGRHLQTILVTDSNMAESMIATLTAAKLGEASIVPEQFIPATGDSQMMTVPEGAVAWALDRVRVAERVKPLIENLLSKVLIVRDLSAALKARDEFRGYSFATLDGAFVSPEGVIKGGSVSEGNSILQRQNEIRDLEQITHRLHNELNSLQSRYDTLSNRIKELQVRLEASRTTVQQAQVATSQLEGKLSLVDQELHQIKTKHDSVSWEQVELLKRQEATSATIASLQHEHVENESSIDNCRLRKTELESGLSEVARQEEESTNLLNELRTAMAVEERAREALQQQKEPIAGRMEELEELITRRQGEVQSFRERVSGAEEETLTLSGQIEQLTTEAETLANQLGQVTIQRGERQKAVQSAEQELLDARHRLTAITEQKGKEEIKITQLELRMENVSDAIRQRYQIELISFRPDTHTLLLSIEEQKKAHGRRNKLRATLELQKEDNEDNEDNEDEAESPVDGDEETSEAENSEDTENTSDVTDEELIGADLEDGPDWEFIEEVVGALKQKLDSIGPVNLDAILEFEELEERHTHLQSEQDDLTNAKQNLLELISRLNKETT